MSDIYLQITETPTVVTLSAPVISGALSSTVTVANVVTVALDSNSLSALENVTVTVGAAITGTVTVSNFPASQAVTFSAVTISNFPSTQAVSLANVPTHGVTLTSTTVTVSSLPALAAGTAQIGSVTASISGTVPVSGTFWQATQPVSGTFFQATQPVSLASTTVTVSSMPAVSGSVTLGASTAQIGSVTASNITGLNNSVGTDGNTPTSTNFIKIGGHQDGSNSVEHIVHVSAGGSMKVDASDSTVTFGTIRGTVTIGNSVTIGSLPALVAGTAQIGSVTASISNSVTIASFATSVTARLINPAGTTVTYAEVGTAGSPSIDVLSVQGVTSGTAIPISISSVTIGSIPAISGTVTANTFALQGTAVTTSNFTSTTASTVLASFNATREVLTIFNEGAGNLHICAGATCTTIAYQVRLSAGDYYEVPNHQTTITHSAVFAAAGTARIVQVS